MCKYFLSLITNKVQNHLKKKREKKMKRKLKTHTMEKINMEESGPLSFCTCWVEENQDAVAFLPKIKKKKKKERNTKETQAPSSTKQMKSRDQKIKESKGKKGTFTGRGRGAVPHRSYRSGCDGGGVVLRIAAKWPRPISSHLPRTL